jgi:outer membrane protein assembly factor BamE
MRLGKKISVIALSLLLTGCIHMYRFNIQQGNVITPDMLAQLKTGMTEQQVQYLMGTPVLTDPLNPNRWDYVYTYKPGNGTMSEKRVTLYFANGALQSIQNVQNIK